MNDSGRTMNDSGRTMNDSGRTMNDSGRTMNDSGRTMNDSGRAVNVSGRTGNDSGNDLQSPVELIQLGKVQSRPLLPPLHIRKSCYKLYGKLLHEIFRLLTLTFAARNFRRAGAPVVLNNLKNKVVWLLLLEKILVC
jgi:hypothetical protein